MWSSIKTDAVVLSVRPWREADREYRALTPKCGKVHFIGRGAQKSRAKLAAHLEPCAVVTLEIVRGARSTTVINVERRRAFVHVTHSLEHRVLMLTSLGLLDAVTQVDEEDPALYDELLLWLTFLEEQKALHATRSTLLLGGFLLRVMGQLGYDVSLLACVGCRQRIIPLAYRWHANRGGLVCADCIARQSGEWFGAHPLSEEALQLMRLARHVDYAMLLALPLRGADVEAFARCVHDLLGYHVPGYSERPFWVGITATQAFAGVG